MKRSLLILFTLAASVFTKTASAQCYDENTHLINLGVGFGNSYYKYSKGGAYEFRRTPIFNLTYEQPLRNKVGPGYIGVGAYFSFQHARQRYTYSSYFYNGIHYQNEAYYQHNWNYYVIAARGAYHWDGLNADKAEVYAGTVIGVRINSYNYTYHNIDPSEKNQLAEGAVYPALSVFAGARWYFAPNVALFGEVSTGLSFLTGGLTFKF